MKFNKFLLSLVFVASFGYGNPVETGHAEVSLIKIESSQIKKNEFFIGIKMDMQKNWHTYWKNSGDAGGPIEVEWELPEDVYISDIFWPAPKLIPYPPLMTYGYKDFVIFPYKINFENANSLTFINANINFLICDDVCVPEKANIKTNFDRLPNDKRLNDWLSKVPSIIFPVLSTQSKNFIEIRFSYNEKIDDIYFFPAQENSFLHAGKQILIKEENNWLLKVPLENAEINIKNLEGVLTINKENYLIDSTTSSNKNVETSISIIQAVIFAFLGGLILNLMPCVFPIISLKILSFVSLAGGLKSEIRKHSIIFSAGAVLSFLLIALTLIILKQAGTFVGWGFQLQSPVIVGSLSILMFLIGLILLMNIDIGTSLTRLGSSGSKNETYTGSFMTGVLAVVVASPCTAPFMGAAIGYALIQPSFVTFPVFLFLGIGFVAPYLLLSFKPELINSLPKSGQWMNSLKEFFAFPMFATALWLLWVYSIQTSIDSVIELLISILIISLLVWLSKLTRKKIFNRVLLLLIAVVIGLQINKFFEPVLSNSLINTHSNKYAWNENIEDELQQDNQAYLINFTAAWCITCQANDKIALSRPRVKEFMAQNNIEYIVADWTNKDTSILKILNKYDRSGVPLYVYWKPGMSKPKILPAILTESIVIESLK